MPPDLAPDTLAAATALTPVSPTRFRARLSADWLGGTGVPFGGYSASLALRAIREAMPGYPDAIAFTLDLFGAPEGPVEIEVSVLKKGKSFGTASATLFELKDGSWEAWGAAQATLGALPAEPAKYEVPEWYSKKPANVPEGDESMDGFEVYNRAGWGLGPPYTDRFEFRVSKMHYEDIRRQIRDARTMNENDPRRLDIGKDLELWVGLRDDPAAMDPLALTVWADMTGAINHGIRFMNSGSESPENSAAPHSTLSLTIHFLAPPSPNTKFVRVRPHLLLRRGTLVEYEVGIWDEKGVLLCVGRQAALVRPIKVEALQEMRKKMGRPKMFGEPVL